MRRVTIVSITKNRQLELPPEIQAKLNPGDEYMIWETGDSILFKKLQKPLQFSELRRRVEALGPDPAQPTLEEISEMVREVRRQNANE